MPSVCESLMTSPLFALGPVWPALLGFLAASVTCLLLVLTKRHHGQYSMDGTVGVQKFHATPTPRIGGVAILVGTIAGYTQASESVKQILAPMLIAGIPALGAGLVEDITKKVGVRARLLATMISGASAWYLTGVAMQNTGVPPLDWALGFTPVAVLFTAFAVAGVTNSVNIVDGFNGLAAGAVSIMLGAMGLISLNVGDADLAGVCFVLTAVALGFATLNWPLGKIFLGDGGAYFLGFLLAWVAVLLPTRNPQINGWVSLLACAYPILEVGFSYQRKSKREGYHPGQPDKLHFHMLVYRRIARLVYPQASSTLQNSMTSPFVWAYALVPAIWAITFQLDTGMLILGFLLSTALYWLLYLRLSQFKWCVTPLNGKSRPPGVPAETLDRNLQTASVVKADGRD
jgi:UDP-N-acetylmuramyl pentapeptide phosphotransferase/UDP-N-acetylglucosamine-1-phosphate transferase